MVVLKQIYSQSAIKWKNHYSWLSKKYLKLSSSVQYGQIPSSALEGNLTRFFGRSRDVGR